MNDTPLITESNSIYTNIERMSTLEILRSINREDKKVAVAISKAIYKIESLADKMFETTRNGGKVFYIGAGTSGRLGVIDASEIPPTFGAPYNLFNGIIAGGDGAIRKAVEGAEDNTTNGWKDLKKSGLSKGDIVIGIAASGTTPYVIHTLKKCRKKEITTGCITCNPESPITKYSDFDVVVVVGPEFITGSSRLKAGTAQKMVLNMLSTATMVRMGAVKDNKMIRMHASNKKLKTRAIRTVSEMTNLGKKNSERLLKICGYSIEKAIERFNKH
jgi:N-acetylmuramic acid 6-phosphate etherase